MELSVLIAQLKTATFFPNLQTWFSCIHLRMPGPHSRAISVCRRGKFPLLKSDVQERVLRETVGGTERNATAGTDREEETSVYLNTSTTLIWSHCGEVVSKGTHQDGFKWKKEASNLLSVPKEIVSGCKSKVLQFWVSVLLTTKSILKWNYVWEPIGQMSSYQCH